MMKLRSQSAAEKAAAEKVIADKSAYERKLNIDAAAHISTKDHITVENTAENSTYAIDLSDLSDEETASLSSGSIYETNSSETYSDGSIYEEVIDFSTKAPAMKKMRLDTRPDVTDYSGPCLKHYRDGWERRACLTEQTTVAGQPVWCHGKKAHCVCTDQSSRIFSSFPGFHKVHIFLFGGDCFESLCSIPLRRRSRLEYELNVLGDEFILHCHCDSSNKCSKLLKYALRRDKLPCTKGTAMGPSELRKLISSLSLHTDDYLSDNTVMSGKYICVGQYKSYTNYSVFVYKVNYQCADLPCESHTYAWVKNIGCVSWGKLGQSVYVYCEFKRTTARTKVEDVCKLIKLIETFEKTIVSPCPMCNF